MRRSPSLVSGPVIYNIIIVLLNCVRMLVCFKKRIALQVRACKYTCTLVPPSHPIHHHHPKRAEWNESEEPEIDQRLKYQSDIPDSPSCTSPNIAARDDGSPSFSLSLAPRAARSRASRAACARIWPIHSSLRPAPPSRASGPASALASSARLSSSSTCALIGLTDRA